MVWAFDGSLPMHVFGSQAPQPLVLMHANSIIANFRAMGTGTSDIYDEVPFRNFGFYDSSLEVNRLYLEYCEKDDLNEYIDKFVPPRQKFHYPPEEYVWRIFGCLAKACLVMEM